MARHDSASATYHRQTIVAGAMISTSAEGTPMERPRLVPLVLILSSPFAAGCVSSGATSSPPLPDWSEYIGLYEFYGITEGRPLGGYLTLHSRDVYSVHFTISPSGRGACERIEEGGELEARARLQGDRLTISCRGIDLVLRRELDGLDGYSPSVIRERRIVEEPCPLYRTDRVTGRFSCVKKTGTEVRIVRRAVHFHLNLEKISG
jgi:hypothetical protein